MFEPLAIGNCTLNAEVSDESSTSTMNGITGVKLARGSSNAKVSAPSAMTVRMYQRPRGGRSRSKTRQVYCGNSMKKRVALLVVAVAAAAGGYYYFASRGPTALVLTGMVTTNDVLVSPQIS